MGTLGHAAAFSFYPTKNLGCFGDAGAVTSNDSGLIERVRVLRGGGQPVRGHTVAAGFNSRCDEMQAAILNCKMPHLDAWNKRRRELASLYRERVRVAAGAWQAVPENCDPVYHLLVVRHSRREALRAHLRDRGIETLIHYPEPLHRQPAFASRPPVDLPGAEQAAREVLSMPIHPSLTESELVEVADAVNEFVSRDPE